MTTIGKWIATIIKEPQNEKLQSHIQQAVKELCNNFPIQPGLFGK